jgi:hypothetical protein
MPGTWVAWVRRGNLRDHWEPMVEFDHPADAEWWLREYCSKRSDSSGVALPEPQKPWRLPPQTQPEDASGEAPAA